MDRGQTSMKGATDGMLVKVNDSNVKNVSQHRASTTRRFLTGTSAVNNAKLQAIQRRLRGRRRVRVPRQGMPFRILRCFLSFLYFSGMSANKPACILHLPKWVFHFQTFAFWMVSILSILQALDQLTFMVVQFYVHGTLLTFLTASYSAIDIFSRYYHITLLAPGTQPISLLLEKIDKVNQPGERKALCKLTTVVVGIGILLVSLTGIGTVFGDTPLNNFSWKQTQLDQSLELGQTIFMWTSANYSDAFSLLNHPYETHLTMNSELFSFAWNTLNFWGNLHSCLLLDLWFIVSIEIYMLQLQFSQALLDSKTTGSNTRCPLSILWQHYNQLRNISEQSNELLGNLFKMVHLQNCLLFCYFLFSMLSGPPSNAVKLVPTLGIVKIAMAYYILLKSSRLNKGYVECVAKCSDRGVTCEMDGKVMHVEVLRKDMKTNPIGVGREDFYVNDTFLLKFASTVGLLFLLLLSGETSRK